MNREEWLTKLSIKHILPLLKAADGKVEYKYRVSVGWPKGSRGGKGAEAIGQCFPPAVSADKVHEIFISPILGAYEAVETLIHEQIHASAGLKAKHAGAFKRLALAVGLTGKMTATVAGPELKAKIEAWIKSMPEYPHGVMSIDKKAVKPGSRLLKACCEGCGYTIRLSRQWLDVAIPACPNEECDNRGEAMLSE